MQTVLDFAKVALPDSVLALWPEDGPACPMPYEVPDAVSDHYAGQASHVDVFLEMADWRQPDAQMFFTVSENNEGICGCVRRRSLAVLSPCQPWGVAS